jgi:hypothetical protein
LWRFCYCTFRQTRRNGETDMTRTVFNNDMVAHVWAQQEQKEGRSPGGSFSFEGAVLFSYATPIARFVDTPNGRAVLVTSQKYSATTSSKHLPSAWRALGYGETFGDAAVFPVPYVQPKSFYGHNPWGKLNAETHVANLAHLAARYNEEVSYFTRARDSGHHAVASLAETLCKRDAAAQRYARLFGLTHTPRDAHADAAAAAATREARIAKSSTPAAIAKREAAARAREAKLARLAELEGATPAEKLEAWRAGEVSFLPYAAARDAAGGVLLRVRRGNVETSQGASVPLDHAVRVFRFAKLCRDRGEAWQRNGRTLRVGHFQVDSVDAFGNFRAGCHLINWPETEHAAKAAGVFDEAAADTRDAPQAA